MAPAGGRASQRARFRSGRRDSPRSFRQDSLLQCPFRPAFRARRARPATKPPDFEDAPGADRHAIPRPRRISAPWNSYASGAGEPGHDELELTRPVRRVLERFSRPVLDAQGRHDRMVRALFRRDRGTPDPVQAAADRKNGGAGPARLRNRPRAQQSAHRDHGLRAASARPWTRTGSAFRSQEGLPAGRARPPDREEPALLRAREQTRAHPRGLERNCRAHARPAQLRIESRKHSRRVRARFQPAPDAWPIRISFSRWS